VEAGDAAASIASARHFSLSRALRQLWQDWCMVAPSSLALACARIQAIWWASLFGSFNGETQTTEPYFAYSSDPREPFAAAAQRYGLYILRQRFPDESETTLKAALSWPLDLLTKLVNRLSPKKRQETFSRAFAVTLPS
jgi:hypothetical protein